MVIMGAVCAFLIVPALLWSTIRISCRLIAVAALACVLLFVVWLRPSDVAPIGFAAAVGAGAVTSHWQSEAEDDKRKREEAGEPLLMKGEPATRGRYDIVWLIRYRNRMNRSEFYRAWNEAEDRGMVDRKIDSLIGPFKK
jgi:hypothetical protein